MRFTAARILRQVKQIIKERTVSDFSEEFNKTLESISEAIHKRMEFHEPKVEKYPEIIKDVEELFESDKKTLNMLIDSTLVDDNGKAKGLTVKEKFQVVGFIFKNSLKVLSLVHNSKAFNSKTFQAQLLNSDKVWDYANQYVSGEGREDKFQQLINMLFVVSMPKIPKLQKDEVAISNETEKDEVVISNETVKREHHYDELMADKTKDKEQIAKLVKLLETPRLLDGIKSILKNPHFTRPEQLKNLTAADLSLLKYALEKERECKVRLEVMDTLGFTTSQKAELREFLTDSSNYWLMWYYLTTPDDKHKTDVTDRNIDVLLGNKVVKTREEAKKIIEEKYQFFVKHRKDIHTIMGLEESIVRPKQFQNNLKIDKDVELLLRGMIERKELRPLLKGLLGKRENLDMLSKEREMNVGTEVVGLLSDLFNAMANDTGILRIFNTEPKLLSALGLVFVQSTPWFQDILTNVGLKDEVVRLGDAFGRHPERLGKILKNFDELQKDFTNAQNVQTFCVSVASLMEVCADDFISSEQVGILRSVLNNFLVPALGSKKADPIVDMVISNLKSKEILSDLVLALQSGSFLKVIETGNAYQANKDPKKNSKYEKEAILAALDFIANKDLQKVFKANKENVKPVIESYLSSIPKELRGTITDLILANATNVEVLEGIREAVKSKYIGLRIGYKQFNESAQTDYVPMMIEVMEFINTDGMRKVFKNFAREDKSKEMLTQYLADSLAPLLKKDSGVVKNIINDVVNNYSDKDTIDKIITVLNKHKSGTISYKDLGGELGSVLLKGTKTAANLAISAPLTTAKTVATQIAPAVTSAIISATATAVTEKAKSMAGYVPLHQQIVDEVDWSKVIVRQKGDNKELDPEVVKGIKEKAALEIKTALDAVGKPANEVMNNENFPKILANFIESKKKVTVLDMKNACEFLHHHLEDMSQMMLDSAQFDGTDNYKKQAKEAIMQELAEDKSLSFNLLSFGKNVAPTVEPRNGWWFIPKVVTNAASSVINYISSEEEVGFTHDSKDIKKIISEYWKEYDKKMKDEQVGVNKS